MKTPTNAVKNGGTSHLTNTEPKAAAEQNCITCHALVCSQGSDEENYDEGSFDAYPHMLVCASPENCQDDKKKKNRQSGNRTRTNSMRESSRRRGQYPTKLAQAKLKAVGGTSTAAKTNNELTPSTAQDEEIKTAQQNSGKPRNLTFQSLNGEIMETWELESCNCSH